MWRFLALIAACAVLAGCPLVRPSAPQVVPTIVVKYRDLPEWATAPLPTDAPANGKVDSLLRSNHARGNTIDFANCRSRLLRTLDADNPANPKECEP